jgi:hypothetical protein
MLVEHAAKQIWTPEGHPALEYLRGRGLTDETTRQTRLGWTPGVSIPVNDGTRHWVVYGIVIPWVERGRLTLVKIRPPEGSKPKYAEAYVASFTRGATPKPQETAQGTRSIGFHSA